MKDSLDIHSLVAYLIYLVAIWVSFWSFWYKFTGIYLGSVTINNGISFNNIKWHTKRFEINFDSVRARLWGNSRKLIIDGLDLKIFPRHGSSKNSSKSSKPKSASSKLTDDSGFFFSIYPKNFIVRLITRLLIQSIPPISVELKRSKITSNGNVTSVDFITFDTNSRYSKKDKYNLKFKINFVANHVQHVNSNQKNDYFPLLHVSSWKVGLNYTIRLKTGALCGIKFKSFTDDLKLSVFKLLKELAPHIDAYIVGKEKSHDNVNNSVDEQHGEDTKQEHLQKEKKLDRMIRLLHVCYYSFESFSLLNENIHILEIPFITTSGNHTFKSYLDADFPITSLQLLVKSAGFNSEKMSKNSAGFHAMFESINEKPMNISASFQLLTLGFATMKRLEDGLVSKKVVEVLNIPNFSTILKGNFLDKLSNGEGFKDCIAELFVTSSNPVLDLDSSLISHIIYNFKTLTKFMKYKKLHRHYRELVNHGMSDEEKSRPPSYHAPGPGDAGTSESEFDSDLEATLTENPTPKDKKVSLKDRLWGYLLEYYPRLDVKFIIEQPRFIMRHTHKETATMDILNFSFSSLYLQIVTTKDRDYNLDCKVLTPCVTYIKKSTTSETSVAKYNILSFNAIVLFIRIHKNFRFDFDLKFVSFTVDLSNLKPLIGIHHIVTDLTVLIENDLKLGRINLALNSKILKLRKIVSSTSHKDFEQLMKSPQEKIFRYLPNWFIGSHISFSSIDINLGSRSVLIPSDKLDTLPPPGDNFLDFIKSADSDTNTDELRCSRFKVNELTFDFKNDTPAPDSFNGSRSTSSETLASEEGGTTYWKSTLAITNIELSTMTQFHKAAKYDQLIGIPSISGEISAVRNGTQNNLKTDIRINNINGEIDYVKVFTLISTFYLVREKILNPVSLVKQKLKKDNDQLSVPTMSTSSHKSKKLSGLMSVNLKLKKSDITFVLHDDYKLKLDSYQTIVSMANNSVQVHNKFLRILTESPTLKNRWCRLGCIDDFELRVNLNNKNDIYVNSSYIKFVHPHKHVVYRVFDNISVTVKVVKHAIKSLKDRHDIDDFTVVHPSESFPKELPNIHFRSQRFVFNMEDDPFESELGMIFQLGRVEQRKRMEMYNLFETKSASTKDLSGLRFHDEAVSTDQESPELYEKLEDLEAVISASWISKVQRYKKVLNDEVIKSKKFLFGNEAKLDSKFQKNIQPYSINAPLISIMMNDLNLNISKTKFKLSELPNFLHKIGHGLPLDTRYSLIIPTYLDLKLGELRMHLRDYPLPLLFVPGTAPGKPSVTMAGHLVIAESLAVSEHSIRRLMVDLVKNLGDNSDFSRYYKLEIEKTLASVKMYTDMEVKFDSKSPSRFVWGQSYQFAIQQVMLNLDQFSKPPIDPSPKLGFWDKLKYILHGNFTIRCLDGPLEVAFKGSRDPYDLFGVSSGFILSFKDNVTWTVNENNSSRDFCTVKADKVTWYILNYLASGLVSWLRDSNKVTYLPGSKKFITSCYAYYLDDEGYSLPKDKISDAVLEKKVVSLSGGVQFRVGFVLQRDDGKGGRTEDCKPHYDINLFNPKFTEKGHDSYKGFRSDYINMAISMDANFHESYNTIHLSPKVFLQFFSWWKLFSGNMQLPIRKGPLFGEIKKSTKFSQHLVSNRFKFNLNSLFISHIYRENVNELEGMKDTIQCYGLRGKMDSFVVDLHQRKEKRIATHETLSRNQDVMKMNFHIGDVHLNGVDLRVISAEFDQNVYTLDNKDKDSAKNSKYYIFDKDPKWFDLEDYEEAFLPSLTDCTRRVHVLPLLFSTRFSYLRDTEPDIRFKEHDLFNSDSENESLEQLNDVFKTERGIVNERIQHLRQKIKANQSRGLSTDGLTERIEKLNEELARLEKNKSSYVNMDRRMSVSNESSSFNNKFILMRMLLKWNNKNRNLLFKYIHFVQLSRFMKQYLSFESISALEEIIESANKGINDMESKIEDPIRLTSNSSGVANATKESMACQDRLNDFNGILEKVAPNETTVGDYLIEILSPQIQLQSDEAPDSVVIVTTPIIDAKILSVYEKSKDRLILNIDDLENRLGCMVNNANVLVFEKAEAEKSSSYIFDETCYGSTTQWPPWLGVEICQQASLAGQDHVLLEDISAMVTYYQLKPLGANISRSDDSDSELSPRASANSITTSGSSRYLDTKDQSSTIQNRLRIDVPKVNITSTSNQYLTLYFMVMDLLLYSEPGNKVLDDKLEKLKFSMDFQNLSLLHEQIKMLHFQNRMLQFLENNYYFRQRTLDNEALNDYLSLKMMQRDISNEIYLLLHSILSGNIQVQDQGKLPKTEWVIHADEIILHMLEDDRTPIIDIAMAKGRFKRIVNEDASNINRIEVAMLQGFNLVKGAIFPSFLEPINVSNYEQDRNVPDLITVDWSMHSNVGGIKFIENFEMKSEPLSLRMDEVTGNRLMNFIFKSDLNNIDESPLFADTSESDASDSDQDIDNNDESDSNSKSDLKGEVSTEGSKGRQASKMFTKSTTSSSDADEDEEKQLEAMIYRSKKYFSIDNLKISPVDLSLSIKLKGGYKRLLNVQDFKLSLPEVYISKRVMSALELTMLLKRIMIKTIMGHLGGLLKNKMKRHKNPVNKIRKPLKPIKKFTKFTPIDELAQQQ